MFKKVYFEAKNDQEAEEIAVSLLKVSSDRIAVNFTEELENGLNRYEAINYLQKEITKLAQELPVHIVVPYNNIKKKNYPKSK